MKIIIIDEKQFDEYTTDRFVMYFRITAKELYKEYRFAIENENMSGN